MTATVAITATPGPRREYRPLLIVGFTITLVVAVYWPTFSRMVDMWALSTYRYAWLVYPIALYLFWRNRHALAAEDQKGSWLGVALAAVAVFVWLLARATGTQTVEFVSVTLLIIATFWAISGTDAARKAAFPLGLLLAAVPTGEFFINYLMESTADTSAVLLGIVGVPAYRDGMFLMLPGGTFEVAEACGGLRYLLAGIFASLAFAYLSWSSVRKRLVFVLLAAVTMVIANGVRAFIVMYVASATHMQVLKDHRLFGMVLFIAVFIGLIYVGERYADPIAPRTDPDAARPAPGPGGMPLAAALAVLLIIAAGPSFLYAQSRQAAPAVAAEKLPGFDGCTGPAAWERNWTPVFAAADYLRRGSYRCGDYRANAYVAGYVNQQQGKELISFGNRIWPHDWRRNVIESTIRVASSAGAVNVRQAFVQEQGRSMLIWYWYQVGDAATDSEIAVKLRSALHVLSLNPVRSSVVAVSVDVPGDAGLPTLREVLEPKALALMSRYRAR